MSDVEREFLKAQLRRLSALWPLQPSAGALDEYARVLWGFTEAEITAAFDQVIDTHTESSAPKPGHIRAAVGIIAKNRRNIPPPDSELVAKNLPTFLPAPDVAAIERWAAEPANVPHVEAELDALTSNWDNAARVQFRHVLRPTAARLCYERAYPKLRVVR